jgi:hypothetical protein
MKDKKKRVITPLGNTELAQDCRLINGNYYKVGDPLIENSGDCYLVKNKYRILGVDSIVYNFTINSYDVLTPHLTKGIVRVNEDGSLVEGYFKQEETLSVITLENGEQKLLFDADSLKNNNFYRERLADGNFYHISRLQAREFGRISTPRSEYKTSLPYDSKGLISHYSEIYNNLYDGVISEDIKKYGNVLEDLSFGLEFETVKGFIPKRITDRVGLIPLRDGSISGIEYVTIPLRGEKGLQTVVDQLEILNEKTTFDDTCSLHLHLGNIPRTKEFILAFFKFTCEIQDEMFSYFPIYKKYNFGLKNKNYSAPYPAYSLVSKLDTQITPTNIDQNFNVLYQYLSEGQSFNEVGCNLDNVSVHPRDPQGSQKWNVHTRYHIHNLIPLIFGNKTTIEFRIHTPTYDIDKIISFILLNSILVNFVKKYQNQILEDKNFFDGRKGIFSIIDISLSNGIAKSYLRKSLFKYLQNRRISTESQNKHGLVLGDESKIKNGGLINWKDSKDFYFKTDYSNYISSKGSDYIGSIGLNYEKSTGYETPTEVDKKDNNFFTGIYDSEQPLNTSKQLESDKFTSYIQSSAKSQKSRRTSLVSMGFSDQAASFFVDSPLALDSETI